MPRPTHEVDRYREHIKKWYEEGIPRSQIKDRLEENFNLSVSVATLTRRINEWGFEKQRQRTVESPEPVENMFRIGLTEKQTFCVLRRQDFSISRHGLAQIRLEVARVATSPNQ